ncbi:glycosyltransferase family 1 protein [Tolypothrix sp. PCC 7910]|uniref:glycosyltransferase n=1 Tax=Tolypothrix sp. PCC 7910 TaxID=2099387 RepID=UPI0014278784|nr:glycosyltransferase [Tolypothrix sp. PCC 7910]QIR38483.1 glycosyltransferase family 1 protein [Tolypothrix sp. PCC 7910]
MINDLPNVYFYIPKSQIPDNQILESPDLYWQWQNSLRYGQGRYNWTLQTYLHLQHQGFPCELVGTLPDRGIILTHRDFLPDNLQPAAELLIVCLRADRSHHPFAQIHVVQNTQDEITKYSHRLWPAYYMPHWPQSGLIPRAPIRGDKFENAAYFGQAENLVWEMQEQTWTDRVNSLGLNWHIVKFQQWHDYSNVDVVIAVRGFDGNTYNYKPASKLYNAWHAGVPIILGRESAYQYERKSELDYIEVSSVEEIITALKRLRDNPKLRQAMIENGHVRATETETVQLTARWHSLIKDIAIPAWETWRGKSNWQRQLFLKQRYLIWKVNNLKNKLTK